MHIFYQMQICCHLTCPVQSCPVPSDNQELLGDEFGAQHLMKFHSVRKSDANSKKVASNSRNLQQYKLQMYPSFARRMDL